MPAVRTQGCVRSITDTIALRLTDRSSLTTTPTPRISKWDEAGSARSLPAARAQISARAAEDAAESGTASSFPGRHKTAGQGRAYADRLSVPACDRADI